MYLSDREQSLFLENCGKERKISKRASVTERDLWTADCERDRP